MTAPDPREIAEGLTEAQRFELVDAWQSLGVAGEFQIMGSTPMPASLVEPLWGRLTPLGLAVRNLIEGESE